MSAVVGFDRRLRMEWLDALADQIAKGESVPAMRRYLHGLLEKDHPAKTAGGRP